MAQYDFLIVGAGLYGSVFAHELRKAGKTCLVIDKRSHRGGNVYCENKEGINVHVYGAHIFHTNDADTWNYVNQFVSFNRFTNSPLANYKGKLYNLPFNMNTFYQLWGISDPEKVKEKIAEQIASAGIKNPSNLEEQAISLVGPEVYEVFIKEYTEKQWGRSCKELPSFIIKRLPVRFTYDNNYFNDKYQGIPEGGYNSLIDALLANTDVRLNVDFFAERNELSSLATHILYTGPIDAYFDYKLGALEYRGLRFETETMDTNNYQGVAVVNYTEKKIPYTRIIEHKHFEFGTQEKTIITREYPQTWSKGMEPYYPVNDQKNDALFKDYQLLANAEKQVYFGGRLAEYRYYDMHQIVAAARVKASKVIASLNGK